MLTYSLPS